MRTLVALDLSYTATGIAVFYDGAFQADLSKTVSSTPKSGSHVERADLVLKAVLALVDTITLSREQPKIFIEDYAFARMQNREAMGELGGIVKHGLWSAGLDVTTLPIATIRKTVTGKGNADKTLVALSLLSKWGLLITQNDLADAAAVGITGDYVMQYKEDNSVILRLPVDVKEALKGYLKNR
jgi:Holliday junction resolvasome RuvABC endonuclease subunit